jgi:photosystem II stability/assembly factor-like uncharacterized protein
MSARNSHVVRGAAILALSLPGLAAAQNPPARGDDPAGAYRYFLEQRALPGQPIPPRARQAAMAQMRARWPRILAQRDALASSVPNLPSSTRWTPLGPRPIGALGAQGNDSGRLNSIAIHPTNPDIIYVAGAQGGIWKTVNGGASWVPLTDFNCSLAMGSVVLDPVNPEIVYAGTGEQNNSADSYYGCGVLRSTDGGQTWVEQGKNVFDLANGGARISRMVVDRGTAGTNGATVVLAASSFGLFRSTTSGNTWPSPPVLAGIISDLVADPVNANTYYAAVGSISTQATTNGVYKSTDNGATWQKVSVAPFPTSRVGRINLAISPLPQVTLYAAIEDNGAVGDTGGALLGIYVTSNGGTTWSQRSATSSSPLCGGGQQCWYDMVIAADPTDANIVYFGGVELFRSTDGGATFGFIMSNSIHVDQHAFEFHPGTPTTVYAGNDGGIWKSTDRGTTWTSLNTNLELTQFYGGVSVSPTSATTILGGTQDNGTLQWGGTDAWPGVVGGDGGFTGIDQLTGGVAFAETQWSANSTFGGPRRRDAGAAPNQFVRRVNGINIADRGQFIPPLVMDPARPRMVYFGTFNLYRTSNFGDQWTNIGPSLVAGTGTITSIGVAASDSLTLYVGSSDGRLSYTHDLGATWLTASIPNPGGAFTDIAVDPRDARTAVAVRGAFIDNNHVWMTTDGGATWTNLMHDLPNIPVLAVVLEPGSRDITIGTDLGVFTLRSGTTSWVPVLAGLPNVAVYDLVYDPPRSRLIAATHGRGMFSLDVTITGLRGDITADGQVTALDAQAILAAVVGNAPPAGSVRFPNGDANCDGQVTALDAMIVLRKAAGITDAALCVGTVK